MSAAMSTGYAAKRGSTNRNAWGQQYGSHGGAQQGGALAVQDFQENWASWQAEKRKFYKVLLTWLFSSVIIRLLK